MIYSESKIGYTINQIRSFAFCKAEGIANERLQRVDELKAIINDMYSSKKTSSDLKDLKEEIAGSHLIEYSEPVKISKEDMAEHNKRALQSFGNFVRG